MRLILLRTLEGEGMSTEVVWSEKTRSGVEEDED